MKGGSLLWMAIGFLAALLFGQAVFGVAALASADPRRELLAMLAGDPELGPILHAADRGDPARLATWLTRAEPPQRQRLALVTLGLIARAGPPGPDGQPLPDDRTPWPFRHRLAAFAAVATGSSAIDLQLSNVYAYALVAGEADPGPRDVEAAGAIADLLERRMRSDPAHEIWDTVGCVRFRAGEWERARAAWDEALRLLAAAGDAGAARGLLEPLYRARRDAAAANLNPPPNTPPAPLPRELRGATVAATP